MTRRIVAAVDMEDESLMEKILRTAADLAGLYGAQVTVVHVMPTLPGDVMTHLPADFHERAVREVTDRLQALAAKAGLAPQSVQIAVRTGSIYMEILAQAEEDDADLIVIGCHSPEIADYLLGSNAARVIRRAPCSVYAVR